MCTWFACFSLNDLAYGLILTAVVGIVRWMSSLGEQQYSVMHKASCTLYAHVSRMWCVCISQSHTQFIAALYVTYPFLRLYLYSRPLLMAEILLPDCRKQGQTIIYFGGGRHYFPSIFMVHIKLLSSRMGPTSCIYLCRPLFAFHLIFIWLALSITRWATLVPFTFYTFDLALFSVVSSQDKDSALDKFSTSSRQLVILWSGIYALWGGEYFVYVHINICVSFLLMLFSCWAHAYNHRCTTLTFH